MKINNIDHIVITTSDLQACLGFYVGQLGMEHRESNGHHNLYFPKIRFPSTHAKANFSQQHKIRPTAHKTSA